MIPYHGHEVRGEYEALLFSKWLYSLRYGNEYFKLIDTDAYHVSYHRYIEMLLQKPETIVRFAVLTDARDVVLGFSVCRGSILDYVHVQKDMRRLGIAQHLVPNNIDTITHLTKTGLSIWGSKCSGWKFNPFI